MNTQLRPTGISAFPVGNSKTNYNLSATAEDLKETDQCANQKIVGSVGNLGSLLPGLDGLFATYPRRLKASSKAHARSGLFVFVQGTIMPPTHPVAPSLLSDRACRTPPGTTRKPERAVRTLAAARERMQCGKRVV
jgi:hypothetical protein